MCLFWHDLNSGRWIQKISGQGFIPVSSTNKTDRHDITEILLKVALNTITLTPLIKQLNFHNDRYSFILVRQMNIRQTKLIFLVVIGTDCIGSCRSNYQTITAMTAPVISVSEISPLIYIEK
jgi:hypothetical protein